MKTLSIIIGIILVTILVMTSPAKALNYAWAVGSSLDDKCMVIVWIRGQTKEKDHRIIYESKKTKNMCTVYVDTIEFEKNFKYCVLSGINRAWGQVFHRDNVTKVKKRHREKRRYKLQYLSYTSGT